MKTVSDEKCEMMYHDMGYFEPNGMICVMEDVSIPGPTHYHTNT